MAPTFCDFLNSFVSFIFAVIFHFIGWDFDADDKLTGEPGTQMIETIVDENDFTVIPVATGVSAVLDGLQSRFVE